MSLCVCLSVSVYLKPVPPELLLQGGNSEGTTSSAIKQIICPEVGRRIFIIIIIFFPCPSSL